MSDDPEVSVAIEQSSPPPETDERKLSNKVKNELILTYV